MVRRLSPGSRKIEARHDLDTLLDDDMLVAMGHEVAACHCGDPGRRRAISRDYMDRGGDWLEAATKRCARAIGRDYAEYSATPD